MDTDLTITLLTITVILLSVVILAILIATTILVLKINKLIRNANRITDNVVAATAWLSPAKLFSFATELFKKK